MILKVRRILPITFLLAYAQLAAYPGHRRPEVHPRPCKGSEATVPKKDFTSSPAGDLPAEKEPPGARQAPKEKEAPPKKQRVRRTVRAKRVSKGPVVDGMLNDTVWKEAEKGGPLTQYTPNEGAEATQLTEFRVLYDREALYIGVWCFDDKPQEIIAREMARDGDLGSDDYVTVVLDTFLDRRNGYSFTINPNGAREDGLITNNSRADDNWNGIWTAETSVDSEGWKVEIRIPFKTLTFDPDIHTWGFNIMRRIKRRAEGDRWNAPSLDVNTSQVSEAGLLTGLGGLKQGIGIDITPYALGSYTYQREDSNQWDLDAGGDLRYRVTPNLTASLSYNTDFAETEVDARRINLTRFPLFFPEKRSFFLEDAGIFEFGDLGTELIPFFSRRIGLAGSGKQVPILGAAKLTGRVENYNIGLIDAYVDDHDGIGEKNAFATRVSRNVLQQSSVGMIATLGDPNSEDRNIMGGTDFQFRTSRFLGRNNFEWNNFILASHTENVSNTRNLAFGTESVLWRDLYYARAQFYQIEDRFNAALGFVPRTGIRAYESSVSYRPRPKSVGWLRKVVCTYWNRHETDLSNELDTAAHGLTPLFLRFESGDEIYTEVSYEYDSPQQDFEISEGVTIPAGEYWWHTWQTGFETASKRFYELEFDFETGDFYRGTRQEYETELELKPFKHLLLEAGYEYNDISLPGGDFHTHVERAEAQLNFTPNLIWYHLVQYDNVSEKVGYNSRIAWEYTPGAYLYLVLNQNIRTGNSHVTMDESKLTLKINYTVRF